MLEKDKRAEFFQKNLGGQAYWQMLVNSGMSRDEAREVVEFLVEERKEVVAFMGGQAVYDSIEPGSGWRDSLFLLSALRLAVEKNNAFRPRSVWAEVSERFDHEVSA